MNRTINQIITLHVSNLNPKTHLKWHGHLCSIPLKNFLKVKIDTSTIIYLNLFPSQLYVLSIEGFWSCQLSKQKKEVQKKNTISSQSGHQVFNFYQTILVSLNNQQCWTFKKIVFYYFRISFSIFNSLNSAVLSIFV